MARAAIPYAFAPEETVQHLQEKGFKEFPKLAFNEQFIVGAVSMLVTDFIFNILGFISFGLIGRYLENRPPFGNNQVVQENKTYGKLP